MCMNAARIERALSEWPLLFDATRYATQISPFIQKFGRDQVYIGFFEDLTSCPRTELANIGAFLGVDTSVLGAGLPQANQSIVAVKPHQRWGNPGLVLRTIKRHVPPLWRQITDNSKRAFHEKPKLSIAQKDLITHMLELEITALEAITGRDLSGWRA